MDAWPREERERLAAWVRQAGERPIRHDTLLRAAGPSRAAMADRLVHTLLRAGAVEASAACGASASSASSPPPNCAAPSACPSRTPSG
ncbi:MAG TPA: hypothetical protein PKE01_16750, partial [Rhodocyclaceae bacterium]|nr:hypothetical protein [Rhodocyclaceae bacterium]